MNAFQVIEIVLLMFAGAFVLALPYLNRITPGFDPDSFMGRLERRFVALRTFLHIRFRFPELGGYVHDTAMSYWISPGMCGYVTGTWTDAAGAVTGTLVKACAAADQTSVVYIPISAAIPSNSVALKGSYLKSIDIYWATTVAALDAAGAIANIDRFVLPANNAAFPALVAHTFTYDTGNDTAAETDDLDEHTMTLTLTTPIWLDNDDLVQVRLTLDAATTSVIKFHGARVNTTLRL